MGTTTAQVQVAFRVDEDVWAAASLLSPVFRSPNCHDCSDGADTSQVFALSVVGVCILWASERFHDVIVHHACVMVVILRKLCGDDTCTSEASEHQAKLFVRSIGDDERADVGVGESDGVAEELAELRVQGGFSSAEANGVSSGLGKLARLVKSLLGHIATFFGG